ncbi:MAG: hypothetical protein HY548_07030, partial [Elusimicrobia bacterium]|nr:hypothetical protein [Elusimicrobiota bacterium]
MTVQRNRWIGTVALCACAVLGIAASVPFRDMLRPITIGILVALGMVLAGFWSLSWALNRSNKVFFSVFVAGTLFRLAGMAATVVIVLRYTVLA